MQPCEPTTKTTLFIIFIDLKQYNRLNNLLYIYPKKIKIKKNKIIIVDLHSNRRSKYIESYKYPIKKPSVIKKFALISVSAPSFYDEVAAKIKKTNHQY